MRIRIRDKYFRLEFERLPARLDGFCDYDVRCIRIRKSLRGEQQLDTILHECLHAAHWDLDETVITQTATDLARVLWRLGYRICKKDAK